MDSPILSLPRQRPERWCGKNACVVVIFSSAFALSIHSPRPPSLPPILRRIGGDIAEVVEGKKKGHFSCLTRDLPPPPPARGGGGAAAAAALLAINGEEMKGGRKKVGKRRKRSFPLFFFSWPVSFPSPPGRQINRFSFPFSLGRHYSRCILPRKESVRC